MPSKVTGAADALGGGADCDFNDGTAGSAAASAASCSSYAANAGLRAPPPPPAASLTPPSTWASDVYGDEAPFYLLPADDGEDRLR